MHRQAGRCQWLIPIPLHPYTLWQYFCIHWNTVFIFMPNVLYFVPWCCRCSASNDPRSCSVLSYGRSWKIVLFYSSYRDLWRGLFSRSLVGLSFARFMAGWTTVCCSGLVVVRLSVLLAICSASLFLTLSLSATTLLGASFTARRVEFIMGRPLSMFLAFIHIVRSLDFLSWY